MLKDGATIVFQGDSITDAGRSRKNDRLLGNGYPRYVRRLLKISRPEADFRFINRGISGNRARDLAVRWQEDCIAENPDYVSILIGVNDTWRRYDVGDETTAASFRDTMTIILENTLANTGAEILLLNPFLLDVNETISMMREDLSEKQGVLLALSKQYNTKFVDLDALFTQASKTRPPAAFSADGVHPTPAGHEMIAARWLEAWQ